MADEFLPRLPRAALVDAQGQATAALVVLWDKLCSAIEAKLEPAALAAALALVNGLIDDTNVALAANVSATATANAAATNAAAATAADARFLSISNSTTTGLTISATDAGADATITMSAHVRHYADGTTANVNGGTVTALAYSTQYFIYYDQASLAGGAVTYAASTSGPTAQTTAAGGAHPNRHYVGSVVTPAALGAASPGAGAVGVTFDQPIGGNWL